MSIFLMAVFDAFLGIREGLLDPLLPCNFPVKNTSTSLDLPRTTTSSHYGAFYSNNFFNAGGSAICVHKNLSLEGAIGTHVVTCQGRDHIVNIQSGDRNLVVVNIHF